MSRTFQGLGLGVLFLACVSLSALAVDISGTWDITVQTPRGDERTSEMKIEQDGDKIKVTMQGFQGDEVTGEGTVSGNEATWTMNYETQRGEMTIVYKATIEGGTMTGQAELGDFGSMDFSAKKK